VEILSASLATYADALAAANGVIGAGTANVVTALIGGTTNYAFLDTNDDNVLDMVLALTNGAAVATPDFVA
jgi:hypothetical protein